MAEMFPTRFPVWPSAAATAVVAVALAIAACAQQPTPVPSIPIVSIAPTASVAPSGLAPSGSATPATASPTPSAASFDPRIPLAVTPVASVPGGPLAVANARDGSGRLFVATQAGQVRIIRDGALVDAPFLDVADRISTGGERGLLGLAIDPSFASNGRFFVDYTDRNGNTVVSSFGVSGSDPDRADPKSERIVLHVDQPYANHNGGGIAFGPDGLLYIALGDGGSGGDPQNNGQRLDTLLGKILRIDVDHAPAGSPYAVPADNPFVGRNGARPEIWLTGLRNPFRFSFDRATGDLWIGDVGQNDFEEIDVVRAGSHGGLNFGWARMEAFHCYPDGDACDRQGFTLPVAEYSHDEGCAVTGGVVYRGSAYPELVGGYIFSDYCSGTLWLLDAAATGTQEPTKVGSTGRNIAGFGEDEAGEVYVADLSGAVLRVVVDR
jgi:glucose/arabinose dehydrogenase